MSGSKCRILLVDDEADHVELIRRAISDSTLKADLSIAASLAEARKHLKEGTPDIMIADYHLPDGNGLELLPGDVEKRTMPIIILTGHGDEKVAAEALKAGALDYIVKTDESLADIPHIIEHALREWQHIVDLRQGEEERMKIQALMNQTSDLVFLCDGKGEVQYVNHAIETLAGRKAEEIIGQSMHQFFDKDCQSLVMENCSAAFGGESKAFELAFKSTGILCEFKIEPYRDETGNIIGILGGVRDISERKRLEKEITENEDRLRIALSAAHQAWFDANVQTGEIQVSPEYAGMIGYDSETFTSSLPHWMESLHPDDHDSVMEAFQSCLASGGPVSMEYRRKTKSGGWAWMSSIGKIAEWDEAHKPLRMIGIHANISERKLSEDALRVSEERLGFAMQGANDGLWDWNLETDEVYYSARWKSMLGYDENELGNTLDVWKELIDPEQLDSSLQLVADYIEGKYPKYETEFRMRHKDGHWVDILARARIAMDESGKELQPRRLVGTHVDISARKSLEAQLQKEREQAQTYFEIAGVMMIALDAKGCISLINSTGCMALGYNKQEVIGRNWFDLCIPEDIRDEVQGVFKQLMAGDIERVEYYENILLTKTGEERTIAFQNSILKDDNGIITGILFSGEDITERKQAELALAASEEAFRATFNQAAVGIAHVAPDGSWVKVNDRLCEIVGYSCDELTHLTFQDITHPDDLELDLSHVNELLAGDIQHYSMEKRYIRKSGEEIWINFTASLVRKEDGSPDYFIAVVEDINERKQAESELAESEAKFKSLIENMTEGVALHEIIYDSKDQPVDYRILDVNPAYEVHTGLVATAARGQLATELYGTKPAPYLEEYSKVARSGEPLVFESYFPPIQKHFEISVFSPQQGQFATIFSDVTERKQTEKNLRDSRERLVKAETIGHLGNWSYEAASGVIEWSDEVWNIFGRSPDPTGISYEKFRPWLREDFRQFHDDLMERMAQIKAGECIAPYEFCLVWPDGQDRWVVITQQAEFDDSGKPDRFFGIIQDVTERKQAEQALRDSENTFRGLAETLQMAIYISTGEEQACEYINPRFTELFGYTMDEIPSIAEWWPLAYPDETYRQQIADEWQARVKKSITTESRIASMETTVTCKDGSKKIVSWGLVSVGKLNYAIGIDLTAQRQAEHELKERFDEIERMNKLMIGRELRMGELRQEIKQLKEGK